MWILGISALFGNLVVLVLRLREKTKTHVQIVQAFFIGNLAFSDFLMGSYMLILGSADLYFADEYFIHSDEWRAGRLCKFAGFICLLSSEASVFFLTAISVDRLLGAGFPLSSVKFSPTSAKLVGGIIWLITFTVSIIPILTAGPDSDWYDLSDVCIGLPLITRPSSFVFQASGVSDQVVFDLPVAEDTKPAWYFSIILFLGINLLCFLVIFICYLVIFIQNRKSGKMVQRTGRQDEEVKLALRMFVIVGTDFVCWMPVIIMGVLSQTGAVIIPLEAYIWSVVFLLPINSSLNPYLYTLVSWVSSKKRQMTMGSLETLKSDIHDTTTRGKCTLRKPL